MKPAATFRPTMTAALCAASLLALGGCASGSKGPTTTMPPSDAHAQLYDASGADRGRVDIYKDGTGLRIELVARGLPPVLCKVAQPETVALFRSKPVARS